jgi:Bifunctional DNA primase/polymerase, N-terminal
MSEAALLAANLARNCGYAVFPVNENKQPAVKDWPHRASCDPDAVMRLWRQHPAPLVGIATGSSSGISVLDIDAKHSAAQLWWRTHHARLLPTRVYLTRSGGLHLYFRHRDGIRNSQGRICPGVDTRGDGGFAVSWWCAGLECKDHSPPAPWPDWLSIPSPPSPRQRARQGGFDDHRADALIARVARASEGERNGVLYWAAKRCQEAGINAAPALLVAATHAGLAEVEARRTIASAMGRQA